MVAGDVFATTRQKSFLVVVAQRAELHGPPACITTDWDAARDSVRRPAGLRPAVVATGYERLLAGPAAALIKARETQSSCVCSELRTESRFGRR